MGSSSNESNSLIVNMKYLALAIALFAAVAYAAPEAEAEAEAAADAYYGYYGRGYGYGYGLGYRGYYGGYYGGYPYGRYGAYGYYKREAEADAEPQFLAPYAPFAYAYAPHYYAVPAASSFQRVDTPAASYGVSQIHKREAEADADPEAEAAADAYYGYYGHAARSYVHRSPQGLSGYYGYPYSYGYGRYGYAGRYGYPYLY